MRDAHACAPRTRRCWRTARIRAPSAQRPQQLQQRASHAAPPFLFSFLSRSPFSLILSNPLSFQRDNARGRPACPRRRAGAIPVRNRRRQRGTTQRVRANLFLLRRTVRFLETFSTSSKRPLQRASARFRLRTFFFCGPRHKPNSLPTTPSRRIVADCGSFFDLPRCVSRLALCSAACAGLCGARCSFRAGFPLNPRGVFLIRREPNPARRAR